jgi:hypothetical protein
MYFSHKNHEELSGTLNEEAFYRMYLDSLSYQDIFGDREFLGRLLRAIFQEEGELLLQGFEILLPEASVLHVS